MKTEITQEQLNQLRTAIEYTRGTISRFPEKSKEDPEWVLIHGGRASSSRNFLDQALNLVNQLRKELK
jgi:hypothetical protein